MIPFQRMSIHNKLSLALGGAVLLAFAVASISLALFGSLTLERRARQVMEPYAHLVSVGAEAAVAFEDPGRAREILNTLRANPQILEAEIVLRDGRLLARYASTKATFHPHPPSADGLYLVQNRAELIQSLQDGAHLHLVMGLEEFNRQTRNFMLVFAAGVLVLLVATTLGLRAALQRTIVRPISTLAETLEEVRILADYHRRVPASGADEVARLGRSFNAMMGAIQERDNDLGGLTLFQRTILDNAAHGIISASPDGIVSSFNRAAERLLGYTADEVVDKQTPACWHDPEEMARRALRLSEELGETILPGFDLFTARPRRNLPEENEWTFIRKDGTRVQVLLSVTALRDESGRITGFVGLTYDLTERKQAEEALKVSEERFRRLAENARDVIYRMSLPDGAYEYMSPAATELFGYAPEEFYGSPQLRQKVLHPDWHGYFEEEWSKLLRGDMPPTYEFQIIHKSGDVRWVNQRNILVRDEGGDIIAIEGIVTDITERKRSEEELCKLNEELSRLNEELEQRVKERTAELEKKNAELHKMNRLFVGRELRMVELKERIKELEKMTGMIDAEMTEPRRGE